MGTVGVKDFWRRAIKHHPGIQQAVSEKDAPIFEHLTNVHVERLRLPNLRIETTMTFEENEYFTNKELKCIAIADPNTNETIEV